MDFYRQDHRHKSIQCNPNKALRGNRERNAFQKPGKFAGNLTAVLQSVGFCHELLTIANTPDIIATNENIKSETAK